MRLRAVLAAAPTPTRAELLAILSNAAALYWKSYTAIFNLKTLRLDEREGIPDFAEQLADAEAGLVQAMNMERDARAALELRGEFPERWRKWPERRTVPRPDLW